MYFIYSFIWKLCAAKQYYQKLADHSANSECSILQYCLTLAKNEYKSMLKTCIGNRFDVGAHLLYVPNHR